MNGNARLASSAVGVSACDLTSGRLSRYNTGVDSREFSAQITARPSSWVLWYFLPNTLETAFWMRSPDR